MERGRGTPLPKEKREVKKMKQMIEAFVKHGIEFEVEAETRFRYGCITIYPIRNGKQVEIDYYFENDKLVDVTVTD